ncbi:MAG: ATP-grasp domain-containing protein, partial [Planctomycetia bacterium]|nr:ATP-grasp domain-containing protein [Planctomycetia bacterium]
MLILGASARAAAWSALRAGLSPSAADVFADRDLAAVSACVRVPAEGYPDGLAAAAGSLPPGPWLYTGALENRPGVIDRVSRTRPLWGNDAATVRAVRDPLAVARALRDAGLSWPEVRLDPSGLPRDGSWLRKPVASAGGYGIEPLEAGLSNEAKAFYYQKRLEGPSLSAVFVGTRDGAVLAGVTRQIIGRPGSPFAYRGNVAPWP